MKKVIFSCVLTVVVLFISGVTNAQLTAGAELTVSVPENCLIDTNGAPVNLTLIASVAGSSLPTVSNSNMYLRISSIVPGGTARKVTVRISSGLVPIGTKLTLGAAASTSSSGSGQRGTVSAPIMLSSTDQTIISGIGSCYTGTGYTDGYRLTYTWGPYNPQTDYQLITATVTPVTITVLFTISAPDGNNY